MSERVHSYRTQICDLLTEIEQEKETIQKAAEIIADAVEKDLMIHVIGPGGHSNMAVEEVLWRAGGLMIWNTILDAGTNLIHGAKRSNRVERTPGYAQTVLDCYGVGQNEGEVIIIVNAYGINSMTIDTVLECKKRGVTTIAVTSSSFAQIVPQGHPARHSSGKSLYSEADVFIDNHLPIGDAIIEFEGTGITTGSTSTFCNCFVMNCLTIEVINTLLERGIDPPVLISANMPGGDEHNKALEDKYAPRNKHLI